MKPGSSDVLYEDFLNPSWENPEHSIALSPAFDLMVSIMMSRKIDCDFLVREIMAIGMVVLQIY